MQPMSRIESVGLARFAAGGGARGAMTDVDVGGWGGGLFKTRTLVGGRGGRVVAAAVAAQTIIGAAYGVCILVCAARQVGEMQIDAAAAAAAV